VRRFFVRRWRDAYKQLELLLNPIYHSPPPTWDGPCFSFPVNSCLIKPCCFRQVVICKRLVSSFGPSRQVCNSTRFDSRRLSNVMIFQGPPVFLRSHPAQTAQPGKSSCTVVGNHLMSSTCSPPRDEHCHAGDFVHHYPCWTVASAMSACISAIYFPLRNVSTQLITAKFKSRAQNALLTCTQA